MGFPADLVKQAWERAGGRCECTRKHDHTGRCYRRLVWENRGREGRGEVVYIKIRSRIARFSAGIVTCQANVALQIC